MLAWKGIFAIFFKASTSRVPTRKALAEIQIMSGGGGPNREYFAVKITLASFINKLRILPAIEENSAENYRR